MNTFVVSNIQNSSHNVVQNDSVESICTVNVLNKLESQLYLITRILEVVVLGGLAMSQVIDETPSLYRSELLINFIL